MQEIITFMIVGAAITLAVLKSINKIKGKRISSAKTDFSKENLKLAHNCDDCSAECMLRNATKPMMEKNKELCREIEIRQKL